MNKQVQVGNLKVNYQIIGSGEPVVILHGWGSRAEPWKIVQQKIAAAGFKVVVPDLIGFGESSLPPRGWCIDDYVQWLESFVAELAKRNSEFSNKIIFIGHSFGGRIMIKASIRDSLPIRALVLCGAAGLSSDTNLKLQIVSNLAKSASQLMDRMRLGRFKDPARDFYYHLLRQRDYLKVSKIMRETFRRVVEEDLSGYLGNIKIPTLIVWGEKDHIVPVKQAYRFHQGISCSIMKIMPGVGHSPQIEQPELLSSILVDFFQHQN